MAYLAIWLGRRLDWSPVTDLRSAIAPFVRDVPAFSSAFAREELRAIALEDVLPAPTVSVAPDEIAAFKADHWTELRAFRVEVEGRLLACARIEDEVERVEHVTQVHDELATAVDEIEARMRDRRWPTTRGVVVAAVSTAGALVRLAATGDPFVAAEAAAPLAAEYAGARVGGDVPKHPLVYAALARAEFA
jgi:hypothetical protein